MIADFPPASNDKLAPVEQLAIASLLSQPENTAPEPMPCVICGDGCGSHVHLVASGVHQNDVLHLVCHDGVHVLRGMPEIGRGSAVVTIYEGECGHRFAEVARSYKGQLFPGWIRLPDAPRDTPRITRTDTWLPTLART